MVYNYKELEKMWTLKRLNKVTWYISAYVEKFDISL